MINMKYSVFPGEIPLTEHVDVEAWKLPRVLPHFYI